MGRRAAACAFGAARRGGHGIGRGAVRSRQPAFPGGSGLPVPRFVSLKSDRVNLRNGPGTDYPTAWVYRRAGLPLEVIKEFEGWRQVRDAEGADRLGAAIVPVGAAHRARAAVGGQARHNRRRRWRCATTTASGRVAVAMVEAGVIANVHTCDGRWCEVSIDKFRGYIEQKKLWGVYEGEIIK